MTDKVEKVLRGYMNLAPAEQTEFIIELNKYNGMNYSQKNVLKEQIELKQSSVGPKNSTCTCCGR